MVSEMFEEIRRRVKVSFDSYDRYEAVLMLKSGACCSLGFSNKEMTEAYICSESYRDCDKEAVNKAMRKCNSVGNLRNGKLYYGIPVRSQCFKSLVKYLEECTDKSWIGYTKDMWLFHRIKEGLERYAEDTQLCGDGVE